MLFFFIFPKDIGKGAPASSGGSGTGKSEQRGKSGQPCPGKRESAATPEDNNLRPGTG